MIEKKLYCSVGVMAHNEERNIQAVLERLNAQRLRNVVISEIIVVASGCTDDTINIVKSESAANANIRLICEPERTGKSSAINIFINESKSDILLLVGADTLPEYDCVEALVLPLLSENIGMTGARPVPLNDRNTVTGFVVNFLWELHHVASEISPKCGEMVAFRKVFDSIPADTVVDEPQIESKIREAGLILQYCPDAVVYNLGPSSIREIIMRRRSIVAGYARLSKRTNYRVSTHKLRWWLIRTVCGKLIAREYPFFKTMLAIFVEMISRALGTMDAMFSKQPLHLWEPAPTTKDPSSLSREQVR